MIKFIAIIIIVTIWVLTTLLAWTALQWCWRIRQETVRTIIGQACPAVLKRLSSAFPGFRSDPTAQRQSSIKWVAKVIAAVALTLPTWTFKVTLLALTVAAWGFITLTGYSSTRDVWNIRQVDTKATVRQVFSVLSHTIPNVSGSIASLVQESAEPAVHMTALSGYRVPPQSPSRITGEFLESNLQYLLNISNDSKYTMLDFSWDLQFPYPVADHAVERAERCRQVQFAPVDRITVLLGSQASAQFNRAPGYLSYHLTIAELRPGGVLELLILLRRAGSPDREGIEVGGSPGSLTGEMGPRYRYIFGHYSIIRGEDTQEEEFYAPFILGEDGTVSVGDPTTAPEHLVTVGGVDF